MKEVHPVLANRSVGVDQFGNFGVASSPANFQYARLSSSNVTSGNNSSSPVTLCVLSGAVKQLWLFNSFDQDVSVTANGVEVFRFESAGTLSADLASNGVNLPAFSTIKVYHNGTAPTVGSIRFTMVY